MNCFVQIIDPKPVSAEATEGGSINVDGMRLWKVVVGSRDDRWLVVGSAVVCHGVAV